MYTKLQRNQEEAISDYKTAYEHSRDEHRAQREAERNSNEDESENNND